MGDLTEHFSLREFLRSDKALELGNNNWPTPTHRRNLLVLAKGMEQVRAALGRPINPTSGYRNKIVNEAVGGVPNSDHALGWACDFPTANGPKDARAIIAAGIKFDQLIHEVSRHILHISFHPRMRGQLLTQSGGPGTAFSWGIS